MEQDVISCNALKAVQNSDIRWRYTSAKPPLQLI